MSASVHEAAARGFQLGAEAYERSRPDYPAEAVDRLVQELEVGRGTRVMDVGAGTGKLTRQLIPTGATLIAVEPVEAMRRQIATVCLGVPVVAGVAEALPFADGSVDAVVVAQAFHWFHGDRALAEIHRVLKRSGRMGLVWNARDTSTAWVADLQEIIDTAEAGVPREATGKWRRAFEESQLFGTLHQRRFSHVQRLDRQGLVERVASMSFVATLPDGRRKEILARVEGLAERVRGGNGAIELPYVTDLYWCARTQAG